MYTGIVYFLKCEPSQCISVVILTMLIIVTVSSQDTAIYIKPTLNALLLLQSRTEIFAFFLYRH